ncbi:MAG: TonB-dependent receptor [Gammaproteobacteria bacterium]|nr:TonB-dependent receptor [Gammaproteobacteria bacterium]
MYSRQSSITLLLFLPARVVPEVIMSRPYLMSTVPVVLAISLISMAYADDDPMVIVITPSAVEQPRDQASTTLTVIDQQTIEESNAGSVAELLRGQAGLHVSDYYGNGSQATVDLRGFGPTALSNTLVLLDGRPLNNSTDQAAPDLSVIDIDDVAQIEILQGSAGVLYGNQAVGGVINIIRKKFTEDSANVTLSSGRYGATRLHAAAKKVMGRTKLAAAVADSQTDNYRDNNKSENQRLSLKAETRHIGFDSYVELETVKDDMQAPGALLQAEMDADRMQSMFFYDDDYFATDTDMLRVGVNKDLAASHSFNIDYSNRVVDREFIISGRTYPGSLNTQDRDTKILSTKYVIDNVMNDSYSSLLFGFNKEDTNYALSSGQRIDQGIRDAYVSSHWGLGESVQIDLGARYSRQKAYIDDSFVGAFPIKDTVSVFNLGYNWRQDNLSLFARADQNYRFPTVEEHTGVLSGEPLGLLTQEGVSLEFGAEYQHGESRYRATIYAIDLVNEIAFDSGVYYNHNLNLDKTRRKGTILEASSQWSKAVNTALSVTLLNAKITDGTFEGNKLPLVPEQTIRLDTTYRHSASLLFGLEVTAVDKQIFGGDFFNQLSPMPSYEVVNAHLSYDYKKWAFAVRINNLLDEEYSEHGYQFNTLEAFYPSPERNFWLSAKYNF